MADNEAERRREMAYSRFVQDCARGICPSEAALLAGIAPAQGAGLAERRRSDILAAAGDGATWPDLLTAWGENARGLADRRADARRNPEALPAPDADWLLAELRQQYEEARERGDSTHARAMLKMIGEHVQVAGFEKPESHVIAVNLYEALDDARKRIACAAPTLPKPRQ